MPGEVTRKGLLQGAAAGGLLAAARPVATARAAGLPTDARPDVVHRGRAIAVAPRGTHVAVAHAARRSLIIRDRRRGRTRTVALGGQPLELAIAPGGALLAVTTASWDGPGLELVRVRDGARRARLAAGPAPFAPAFTPDGDHLLLTGGEHDGSLRILRGPGFTAGRSVGVGVVPRGLAATAEGVWIALHGEACVVRVGLRSGRIERRLSVPALPDRIALSPGGRTLLVSHGGHDVDTLTELDTRTGRVRRRAAGGAVTAVAWGAGGRRLAALHREDAIAVIAPGGRRRLLPTVAGPRGLAVAGRHVFTTSSVTGAVGRVRA